MTLLTKRERRDQYREALKSQETPPRRPLRKRRRWWLVAMALILATFLWLLPAIVAHTPLLHWTLAKAAADLNGTVTVQSASLGWFSPIVADGIEVRDAQGQLVLQAAELKGNRSLAAILLNSSMLGQFQLEEPKLTIRLRNNGSNVEDLLANYLTPDEEPFGGVSLVLMTVDGSVSVTDQNSRQTWQIEKLRLSLSTSAEAAGPLKLETAATIPDPQHPGRFAVGLTMRQHETGNQQPVSAGELTIESDDIPLAMFESLIGRFAPQTRLAGRLCCEVHAQWGGEAAADKTVVRADLTTDDLALAMPPLGTDQVQLKHLHAACQITRQDDQLEIEQSSLDCDLGNASFRGTLELGGRESRSLLTSALYQTHEINGRIDLACLAQMLPNTLRIRKETQITSGQVQLALSSRPDPQGPNPQVMVWQARIEASNLTAVHDGRQLAWERPILLTLAAYDSQEGPVVESLKCESDFLKFHAIGSPNELAASASFNLKRLADQLGQFVDLGGIGFAGDGWGHFNWKRSAKQEFEADAELQIRDFRLAMPDQQPWLEENLLLLLSVGGRTDLGADTQLQDASLQVRTATDRIEARLTQPVLDFRGGGTWPVDVKVQGQLQPWPARVGTWIDISVPAAGGTADWDLAGAYELTAQATASMDGITIGRAMLTVEQLQLLTPSLSVKEPNVELALSGRWDRQRRRLQMESVALTSGSLSIQADHLLLAIPKEGPLEMAGFVKYRGDLERLHQWIPGQNALRRWRMAGQLSGTAELAQSGGVINVEVGADIGNLVVTPASGEPLDEPLVHLVARGSYEHRAGMLQLEHLELASGVLGGNAAGRIAHADDQTNVQLAGQIQYDLEKLSRLLRPYIGPGVRIAGSGTSPASYRGPLQPAVARADAGVRWEWADVYGFQVGPGELKATLAGGILQAESLDLAVGQGRLLLAPKIRLAQKPIQLTLPPGRLVQQVQITPAMCASGLKYIAPVLAGVTTAEGSFSIELDGCRIPLADPAKGELAGRFTIHSVQIGPGPLVRELAVLLGKAAPAKLRRQSVVPFRMVDGRVYHQNLELVFPDLTVRTYGSVGLDQTLAVMAEMPVPPKWLGNNVLGSALRNQTIRLPIRGTLNKPKIDQLVLDQLSRQFLENAARNVIEHELGKQLERLFDLPR